MGYRQDKALVAAGRRIIMGGAPHFMVGASVPRDRARRFGLAGRSTLPSRQCHGPRCSGLGASSPFDPSPPRFGREGNPTAASVPADCSALCSLELNLPKLLFKKLRGYRVQVMGMWVSQGFSRSFCWPWRTARKSWLWLRRFLLLPVLHDSVAEPPGSPTPSHRFAIVNWCLIEGFGASDGYAG